MSRLRQTRALFVQYQGIAGNAIDQFKEFGKPVIIYSPALKSGEFKYLHDAIAQ